MADRTRVELAMESVEEYLIKTADKLRDVSTFERVSNLAWTQAQVTLHYLGIEQNEANLFQELANRFLYLDSSLRPSSEILKRNNRDVTALWTYGISGDHPIVLVHIDNIDELSIIRQLLRAHEYWSTKRLVVDLVIINEKPISYSEELHESLEAMVRGSTITAGVHADQAKGKVFVFRIETLSEQDRDLLQTAARANLLARQGSLAEQVRISMPIKRDFGKRSFINMRPLLRPILPIQKKYFSAASALPKLIPFQLSVPILDFFNGLGGFADRGREYVIHLKMEQRTPAPWINIVANPEFGFQVSESGAGYTWCLNSRENQITPWSNDPVCDPSGECFYIFDNDSKNLWCPTASPIRINDAEYLIHHGQGYSRFELINQGIYSDLTQFVHWNETVKISKLVLKNLSKKTKNITLTGYVEWVLGFSRAMTSPYVITETDYQSRIVFARNPWNTDFGKRVAFATFIGESNILTCDRTDFLGRNGDTDRPAAIFEDNNNSSNNDRELLSTKMGMGLDPCAAIQKRIMLKPGETVTVVFLLGQVENENRDKVHRIIEALSDVSQVHEALQVVITEWDNILTKIQVETPDLAMDIMLNRWLLYQTTVCRLWARCAFYQAGGAFGFRDQLQDSLALIWTKPEITKAQIIRAASRQFIEGDVQHWWHIPSGKGVRTRFSDDLLWLPFVVSCYLKISEDQELLDVQVPFLEGQALKADQEDAYYIPSVSQEIGSIYEHCARAIDRSLSVGAHGLPLMGSGDWNDGMNHVGVKGKGESVWLAWFLCANLTAFSKIALTREHQQERAQKWSQHAINLKVAIEKEAWDGAWYRRAYFDDGTALGNSSSLECRIDSIAQTWGVISGMADRTRVELAMESVEEYLIKTAD
ncbi:MAG: phosphorylase, partial [Oligoflexia bacterium]|nr:phosphorylase [Oligoflexia bacterium]